MGRRSHTSIANLAWAPSCNLTVTKSLLPWGYPTVVKEQNVDTDRYLQGACLVRVGRAAGTGCNGHCGNVGILVRSLLLFSALGLEKARKPRRI